MPKSVNAIALLSLALLAAIASFSGCGRGDSTPKTAAAEDPWPAKLAAYSQEYRENKEKMKADLRAALRDAQAGNLDADQLAHDIAELNESLKENRDKLQDWNRAINDELVRRGLKSPSEDK